MRYVFEDAAALAPGDVVVADGCKRRMLVTKVIVGFAECIWFQTRPRPRPVDIFHVSVLTRSDDQKWRAPYEEPR